jgi:hypothetical protein
MKLNRQDVRFSISILEDNIEHIDTMLKVESNGKRYGSQCVVSPLVATKLKDKRDSLTRTVEWLKGKVTQGEPS